MQRLRIQVPIYTQYGGSDGTMSHMSEGVRDVQV